MEDSTAQAFCDLRHFDPFDSFHGASRSVLEHLYADLGFDLWMVTRTEGDDWIVLQSSDQGYGVQRGDVFRWTDSFCSRMVQGLGPCIAPRSDDISVYASAPIGQQVPIGAYIGVPLQWADGRLFGTLCAIHPSERPEWISTRLPLLELFARLLSSILQAEIKASEQNRRAERAQMEAMTDELTGLYNRRGWNRLVAAEEARCHRYGHPACLISVDLDGLKITNDTLGHAKGDEFILGAARAIGSEMRSQDVAARLGGDEFGILAVECDRNGVEELLNRIQNALAIADVCASLGVAMCHPNKPFADAWDQADRAMYAQKQSRARTTVQASSSAPLIAASCSREVSAAAMPTSQTDARPACRA